MKKKMMYAVAVVVSVAAAFGLSSFSSEANSASHHSLVSHADCEGKHCTYTEGCDCSGFAPVTGGSEWQKEYCRRCGHHRQYHR
ncbi:MAG: hypothetical protein IIV64_05435 [Muribaculaceae bacterium]|nr:hypothetical protein [Muribaculaceae bacterium]